MTSLPRCPLHPCEAISFLLHLGNGPRQELSLSRVASLETCGCGGEAEARADLHQSPATAPVLTGGGSQGSGVHPRDTSGAFLWLCAGTRHEDLAGGGWHQLALEAVPDCKPFSLFLVYPGEHPRLPE